MTEQSEGFTEERCQEFIDATAGRDTPELLRRALGMVDKSAGPVRALEMGCGAGDDAVTMLKRGYAVTVVDEMAAAIRAVSRLAEHEGVAERLTTHKTSFADFPFEEDTYDLINARASIPFCRPADFEIVWRGIRSSLRPGGVFSGYLFGPNESFLEEHEKGPGGITAHTPEEVAALLAGWIVHHLEEIEADGLTALGKPRHRHNYHIIATPPTRPHPRKPPPEATPRKPPPGSHPPEATPGR